MSNQIVNSLVAQSATFTTEDMKILEQAAVIPRNTPPAQAAVFARVCAERGLSPFSREVYLTGYMDKRTNEMKFTIICGINGFRKIAGNTGQLAGMEDAKFDMMPDGTFKTAAQYGAGQKPTSATVTVWRLIGGQRVPFTHTALFREFASDNANTKWPSMPFQMLAKVAEAFALRKGFSGELSGIVAEEEMAAIQNETIASQKVVKQTPTIDPEKLAELIELWESKINQAESFLEVESEYRSTGFTPNKNPEISAIFFKRMLSFLTKREQLSKLYQHYGLTKENNYEITALFADRQQEITHEI